MPAIRHSIDWPITFERREELAVWTAPATGRTGEMCALYEASGADKTGRKAWVAFGRLCTDAVYAVDGDQRTWAWIQWRRAARPIPYDNALDKTGIASVQGSYGALTNEQWAKLKRLFVRADPVGARRLVRWEAGLALPTVDRVPYRDLAT